MENISCNLTYVSDRIRLDYLKEGLNSIIDIKTPSSLEIYNSDDMVIVKNHGDYVIFYEYFVNSCWEALFQKEGYEELDKKEALIKLVNERFKKITEVAGENIIDWKFKSPVLEIKISNSTKKKELIESKDNQTKEEFIKQTAKKADIDISKYDMKEMLMGYDVELEHGTINPLTNITNNNPIKTLKIVIAHLDEKGNEKYYTKLKKYVENKQENLNESYLIEKSVSKSQQRFMGQVYALKSGKISSEDINPKYRKTIVKNADSMKTKDVKDFAKTKTKGLPEKVEENSDRIGNVGKHKLIIKKSVDNIKRDKIELIQKFILFCLKEMNIDYSSVSVYLTGKRGGPITTTASFNPDNKEVWIYTKHRNLLADVMRSLAHELTHLKQDVEDRLNEKSGITGSNEENEANATAGVMIRKFGKLHPEIFE